MSKYRVSIQNSSTNHEEKFKALFREYFSSLCLFARRYLYDTELAKDIVCDVFTGLWESHEQLDLLLNEKGYLYTLVRNHCLDVLRKQSIRNKYSANYASEEKGSDPYFEMEVLREETYRQLNQAIHKLPERSREILQLKMSGLKNQEIADKLQLSINTINTLKTNAYKMLRDLLKDKFMICWFLFLSDISTSKEKSLRH